MIVLAKADLSFVQPITSLSFITVAVCSVFFFHERLSPLRAVGIVLILAGVRFISQTDHRTAPLGGHKECATVGLPDRANGGAPSDRAKSSEAAP
jgi:drug/metabolite transporter (DMT)-like permease